MKTLSNLINENINESLILEAKYDIGGFVSWCDKNHEISKEDLENFKSIKEDLEKNNKDALDIFTKLCKDAGIELPEEGEGEEGKDGEGGDRQEASDTVKTTSGGDAEGGEDEGEGEGNEEDNVEEKLNDKNYKAADMLLKTVQAISEVFKNDGKILGDIIKCTDKNPAQSFEFATRTCINGIQSDTGWDEICQSGDGLSNIILLSMYLSVMASQKLDVKAVESIVTGMLS